MASTSTSTIDGWRFLVPVINKITSADDEVFIRRPPQSENSKRIMNARYITPGDNNYTDICKRVALSLSEAETTDKDKKRKLFEEVMLSREFIPGGRTLRNAGSGDNSKITPNCIVLKFDDSLSSILKVLWEAGILQKAGSGLGFCFSELRPTNELVVKSNTRSSGPVSFMKAYDAVFSIIKQQNRNGANMAVMRVDHPDIYDFISSKKEEGLISNFNISVALTDAFMRDATDPKKRDEPWDCFFGGKKYPIHKVSRRSDNTVIGVEPVFPRPSAYDVFNKIARHAWDNGEPGFVFIDEVNKTNPLPGLGDIKTCNPCVSPINSLSSLPPPKKTTQTKKNNFPPVFSLKGRTISS